MLQITTPSRCISAAEGDKFLQKEGQTESDGPTSDYCAPEQLGALNTVIRHMLEVGISLITPSHYELAHAATRWEQPTAGNSESTARPSALQSRVWCFLRGCIAPVSLDLGRPPCKRQFQLSNGTRPSLSNRPGPA